MKLYNRIYYTASLRSLMMTAEPMLSKRPVSRFAVVHFFSFFLDESRYFGILIGALVLVFGTVGNGITVWAYLRNKNLQTSFNVLIANLCLIDLLFTIIVIPFLLPGYIIGVSSL